MLDFFFLSPKACTFKFAKINLYSSADHEKIGKNTYNKTTN